MRSLDRTGFVLVFLVPLWRGTCSDSPSGAIQVGMHPAWTPPVLAAGVATRRETRPVKVREAPEPLRAQVSAGKGDAQEFRGWLQGSRAGHGEKASSPASPWWVFARFGCICICGVHVQLGAPPGGSTKPPELSDFFA